MASSSSFHPVLAAMLEEFETKEPIARIEQVYQFDAPASNNWFRQYLCQGKHKYHIKHNVATRHTGGVLGIDVIKRIIVKRFGRQILAEYASHVGTGGIEVSRLSESQVREALNVEEQVLKLELPNRQGWSDYQHAALNYALIEFCKFNRGMVYQAANACFIIKSHHSNGARTALGAFIHSLSTTNIDVQQYLSSMLNGTVKGAMGKELEESLQANGYIVAHYDFSLPIGKDKDGNDIFLSDAGTDGGALISVDPDADMEGQGRAFFVEDLFDNDISGGTFKGADWRANVWVDKWGEIWVPNKVGFNKKNLLKVFLNDINKPKCGAKKLLELKDYQIGKAKIIHQPVYGWFIVNVEKEEDISYSFQEMPYWVTRSQASSHGIETAQKLAWKHWNKISAEDEVALKKLLKTEDSSLFGKWITSNPHSVTSRIVSTGGITYKLKTKKVRGNKLIPIGLTLVDESHKGLRKVIHKRYPILMCWGLTVNYSMSLSTLREYANMDLNDQRLHNLLSALKVKAGRRLIEGIDDKYDTSYLNDVESLRSRLVLLSVSMVSVPEIKTAQCFVALQDGIARNEDHDGDSTVCDSNSHMVKEYEAIEDTWTPLEEARQELPKESQLNYASENDEFLLIQLADGTKILNPKGMRFFDMCNELYTDDNAEKLKICVEVLSVDPQGPTGLFSNVGVEVFSRIKFKEVLKEGTNFKENFTKFVGSTRMKVDYTKIEPEDDQSWDMFKLWVVIAACVQLSIDWQKRAYRLMLLEHYKEMYEALKKGVKAFTDYLATMESTMQVGKRKMKVLHSNRCYNPEIIYGWVRQEISKWYNEEDKTVNKTVCAWKQDRYGGWSNWDDSLNLSCYNESRFKNSLKFIVPFLDYVELYTTKGLLTLRKIIGSELVLKDEFSKQEIAKIRTHINLCHVYMAQYFDEVDSHSLRKINPIKKMKFIFDFFNIDLDDINNERSFNFIIGQVDCKDYSLQDFLKVLTVEKQEYKNNDLLVKLLLDGLVKQESLTETDENRLKIIKYSEELFSEEYMKSLHSCDQLTNGTQVPRNGEDWSSQWKNWQTIANHLESNLSDYMNAIVSKVNEILVSDPSFYDFDLFNACTKSYIRSMETARFMVSSTCGTIKENGERFLNICPHYWIKKKGSCLEDSNGNFLQPEFKLMDRYQILSNVFKSQHPVGIYWNSFAKVGFLKAEPSRTLSYLFIRKLLKDNCLVSSSSVFSSTGAKSAEAVDYATSLKDLKERQRLLNHCGSLIPATDTFSLLNKEVVLPFSDDGTIQVIESLVNLSSLIESTNFVKWLEVLLSDIDWSVLNSFNDFVTNYQDANPEDANIVNSMFDYYEGFELDDYWICLLPKKKIFDDNKYHKDANVRKERAKNKIHALRNHLHFLKQVSQITKANWYHSFGY